MTINNDDELQALREIGRIVAETLAVMGRALEPGMTTAELDAIGRGILEREGALSAPETVYGFPGATCISVNEEVAHGIDRVAPQLADRRFQILDLFLARLGDVRVAIALGQDRLRFAEDGGAVELDEPAFAVDRG